MIKTKIYEAFANGIGKIEERLIGWTLLPEVPVAKGPIQFDPQLPMPQPPIIQISGRPWLLLGHSWDVQSVAQDEVNAVPAVLILVVQIIPQTSSGLVMAGPDAMGQVKRMVPEPGAGKRNGN